MSSRLVEEFLREYGGELLKIDDKVKFCKDLLVDEIFSKVPKGAQVIQRVLHEFRSMDEDQQKDLINRVGFQIKT